MATLQTCSWRDASGDGALKPVAVAMLPPISIDRAQCSTCLLTRWSWPNERTMCLQGVTSAAPSATPLPAVVLKKRRAGNPREKPVAAGAGAGEAAATEYP